MDKKTVVIGGVVLVAILGVVGVMNLPENPAKDLPRAQDANEQVTPALQKQSDSAVTYTLLKRVDHWFHWVQDHGIS